MTIATIEQSKLARTGEEYLALLASNANWFARTADDVRLLRGAGAGGFAKLTDHDFTAFLASLEFNRGGLSTAYYKPLMASLTLTEIFEVFEQFGMARDYTLRTLESRCVGGACSFSFWHLCTAGCETHLEP